MDVISAYLEHREYLEEFSKQQKRDFRKRAAEFTLMDDMLHCYYYYFLYLFRIPTSQKCFSVGSCNSNTLIQYLLMHYSI